MWYRNLVCILCFVSLNVQSQDISLAGEWVYRLDPENRGIQERWYDQQFDQQLELPGTLDGNKIGSGSTLSADKLSKEVLLSLTRKHRYIGVAWYQKELSIPANWKDKDLELFLERVLWETRVWIDGKEIGMQESLSTPQRFNTGFPLSPGRHTIVLRIDNSKKYDNSGPQNFAHAYTDGTQIIWNGVIGKMALRVLEKFRISGLQVYPNAEQKQIRVQTSLTNSLPDKKSAQLEYTLLYKNRVVNRQKHSITIRPGKQEEEQLIPIANPKLWDEFNPELYQLQVTLSGSGLKSAPQQVNFGMRKFSAENGLLQLNGNRIFLRGTLECAIFPLTGHPPMDKNGWVKVFGTARSYGLNHLRFHSWCPPKAAFEVADSMGFYLQVENPLWITNFGKEEKLGPFITEEAERILKEYGNHPSFAFWSMGNELEGDFDFLQKLVESLKQKDPRHLYSTTSFTFMGGHGAKPEPADDFFITQWTNTGWVRGQGIFNDQSPEFNKDYTAALKDITVPVISHEIGQYSVYPRLDEIDKYTGVLDPLNFKAIQKDLQQKGLYPLWPAYTAASGALAANLYKEEIERALKTKNFSGFQLLDLHDFPGQGTALVGLLDAFWDSKGILSASEFRQFCSPVVPLIRYPKAVYTADEKFTGEIEVANFSNKVLKNQQIRWEIRNRAGKVYKAGILKVDSIPLGNCNVVGHIELELAGFQEAAALQISTSLLGTDYKNEWKIWVYPSTLPAEDDAVEITSSIKEAKQLLEQGKTVLLNPDTSQLQGVDGRYTTVFWSPVHFPNQPGTMGLLIDTTHPAFEFFPTDYHTNWQWWDLIRRSKTMVLDSMYAQCTPITTMVDNFYKNRRLTNLFETSYGRGKLLVVSMDISNELDKRPEARQLRYSLIRYMSSNRFNPATRLMKEDFSHLFKE